MENLNIFNPEIPEDVERVSAALQMYGCLSKHVSKTHGPRINRYLYEVPPGAKLNKINRLGPELTAALSAPQPVVVEAPIHGTPYFAVDVPREDFDTVHPRELWEAAQSKFEGLKLPVCAGLDMNGGPLVVDLASCPHLMVAGSSNSGKSVFVHAALCGMLQNVSAAPFALALVDLKQVELEAYSNAKNLAFPVAHEAADAVKMLGKLVELMEIRYSALRELKCANVYELNAKKLDVPVTPVVCVIDELADMMQGGYKDVTEGLLTRLLQKCRGAGIHFVISVQRPCAKAVAGVIKANITARVAFRTASGTDSRIILDKAGAENLAGKGDGLFRADALGPAPVRFQAPYLAIDDVRKIVREVNQ